MKSISDIRRDNLKDLIDREFNGVQSRLAERMGTEPNLVSRWSSGKKIIGDQSARKIEKAGNKPLNWLDVDHYFALAERPQSTEPTAIGEIVSHNLKRWMASSRDLSSQQRVADAAHISQATINRILRNEVSATVANLEAISRAFGRSAYEILIPPNDPATISYDRARYALLPEADKDKVESYVAFVMTSGTKKDQ